MGTATTGWKPAEHRYDHLDDAIRHLRDMADDQDSRDAEYCRSGLHGADCCGEGHVNARAHLDSILADGDGPRPGTPWSYPFYGWSGYQGVTVSIHPVSDVR